MGSLCLHERAVLDRVIPPSMIHLLMNARQLHLCKPSARKLVVLLPLTRAMLMQPGATLAATADTIIKSEQ